MSNQTNFKCEYEYILKGSDGESRIVTTCGLPSFVRKVGPDGKLRQYCKEHFSSEAHFSSDNILNAPSRITDRELEVICDLAFKLINISECNGNSVELFRDLLREWNIAKDGNFYYIAGSEKENENA